VYFLIELLFGNGDPGKTIRVACRCGQDSDCNPSSAADILFTTLGYSKLPERFTEALDEKPLFSPSCAPTVKSNFLAVTAATGRAIAARRGRAWWRVQPS
jgi:hypothetical protein